MNTQSPGALAASKERLRRLLADEARKSVTARRRKNTAEAAPRHLWPQSSAPSDLGANK